MNKKGKSLTDSAYKSIARELIEFGYSDITPEMISEIHQSMKAGQKGAELPHGIIGMFAEPYLKELDGLKRI